MSEFYTHSLYIIYIYIIQYISMYINIMHIHPLLFFESCGQVTFYALLCIYYSPQLFLIMIWVWGAPFLKAAIFNAILLL